MEKHRVINRLTFILLLIVGGGCYLGWSSRDLSGIQGYPASSITPEIRAESQLLSARVKAALSAGQPVRISEQELNVHLASTIQYRQNFALRPWVVPTGIYLSLQADQVELCLERQIGTHPHHSQLVLSLLSTESITPQGRIAELNVAPHSAMIGRLKLPALLGQTFHAWYPPYAQQVVNYYQSLHLPPSRLRVLDGELLLTPLQPPSS